MCYSAQVEASLAAYVRATGAQMDIQQFEEIFGQRLVDTSIKIPRAVDLWFERPEGADQLRLRNLVMQYRTAKTAELQADIAKQRERLAAAEAKLATKPTKAAANDLRIATDKIASFEKRLPLFAGWEPTRLDDRIFPMQYAPIVMMADGKPVIRLARYHCRLAGKPESVDRQYPGLYNARRDNIDKYWSAAFGTSHALMLVKSFYENVDRYGKNAVLHFTPDSGDLMLIACVYSVWKDPEGKADLLSFAAVTDDPPPEVAAAGHDRIIINLGNDAAMRWLRPQGLSPAELQAILDDRQRPFYAHAVMAA